MVPVAAGGRLWTTGCDGAGRSVVQPALTSIDRVSSRTELFFRFIIPATIAYGYHG